MSDQSTPKQDGDAVDLNHRRFVKTGSTSLAIAGVGACVFGLRYLSPNVLYEPSPVVNAGKPEHYRAGSVTLDAKNGIFVIRAAEGFYALSAVCTHLGCLTTYKPDTDEIDCPCHGSTFRKDGRAIAGPAPQALPWLKVWLAEDGNLMVDRATRVAPYSEYVTA